MRSRWSWLTGSVLVAVVVTLGAFPAGSATADPHDDLARVNRQLAKTKAALEVASDRVQAAALALEDANRRLPAARRRVVEAQAAVESAKVKAEGALRSQKAAEAELSAADHSLLAAQDRVEQSQAEIGEFAARAYKGRDLASLSVLLTTDNPGALITGLTYLQRTAQQRNRVLAGLTAAQNSAEYQRDDRTIRAVVAQAATSRSQAAVAAAHRAAGEAQQAQRELAVLIDQRQHALAVAKAERAATEARYQQLQEESARIEAEIRTLAKAGGPVLRPGARLPMPVRGYKTSDFGMRFDPYYHVWRLHAGVDLAAPRGSSIWAVAAGRVFRAGWNGGYGNYTCIYHGTYQGWGFATCYAHQSAIGVSVGQQVRRGQLIGRVGSTGASTGNHLHFEVRLDGTPVNPLPWLPACLC